MADEVEEPLQFWEVGSINQLTEKKRKKTSRKRKIGFSVPKTKWARTKK